MSLMSTTPASILNFCHAPRQSRKRSATSVYLTWNEKVRMMNECNEQALILYEFYLSKAAVRGYAFEDAKAASALDWKISKVKRVRQDLTNKGYFLRHPLKGLGKGVLTILDPTVIREVTASSQDQARGRNDINNKALEIVLAQLKRDPEVAEEIDELLPDCDLMG